MLNSCRIMTGFRLLTIVTAIMVSLFMVIGCGGGGGGSEGNDDGINNESDDGDTSQNDDTDWKTNITVKVHGLNEMYTHPYIYYELRIWMDGGFPESNFDNYYFMSKTDNLSESWDDEDTWVCNYSPRTFTVEDRTIYVSVKKTGFYAKYERGKTWQSEYITIPINESSMVIEVYPNFEKTYAISGTFTNMYSCTDSMRFWVKLDGPLHIDMDDTDYADRDCNYFFYDLLPGDYTLTPRNRSCSSEDCAFNPDSIDIAIEDSNRTRINFFVN